MDNKQSQAQHVSATPKPKVIMTTPYGGELKKLADNCKKIDSSLDSYSLIYAPYGSSDRNRWFIHEINQ